VAGVADFDVVIDYGEIDRFVRFTDNLNAVPTGVLQL